MFAFKNSLIFNSLWFFLCNLEGENNVNLRVSYEDLLIQKREKCGRRVTGADRVRCNLLESSGNQPFMQYIYYHIAIIPMGIYKYSLMKVDIPKSSCQIKFT